jgi:hypothetical protein
MRSSGYSFTPATASKLTATTTSFRSTRESKAENLRPERAAVLKTASINIAQVLSKMEAEQRVNLVFLDACAAGARNPWTRRRRIKLAELIAELWVLPPAGSRPASIPPTVASPFGHGIAVLKARTMGRGIEGLGSNVGPLRALCADAELKFAPPSLCRGDCGLGGASRQTMLGAGGVPTRRRYPAGVGEQINKLWGRRVAALSKRRTAWRSCAELGAQGQPGASRCALPTLWR